MRKFCLFTAILLVLCCACENNSIIYSLLTAKAIMQDRPDSALTIIRQIDTNELRTSKWKAHYALLKAIALDKNYIDTASLSFLLPAEHYFQEYGSQEEKMLTKYYMGRIQYNADNLQSAIISFLDALSYSHNVENEKQKGMIYSALGDTYNKSHNNKDELKYELLAFNSFERIGDPFYLDYARYNLAIAYHNNRVFDKADSLLTLIGVNDYLVNEARIALADNELHKEHHNAEKVVQLFESAISSHAYMDIYRYYEYAYSLIELSRYNDAENVTNTISNYPDNAKTIWWKYKINKLKNNNDDALAFLEKYNDLTDSIVVSKLEQSIYKAQADHYALLSEIDATKSKNSRIIVVFTVIGAILLLSISFLLFKSRKNRILAEKDQLILQQEEVCKMLNLTRTREKLEGEKAKEQISALSKQNDDFRERLQQLRYAFAKMYRKQFDDIQSLYSVNQSFETLSERIIKSYSVKYSKIITDLIDPKKQSALEDMLNADLDNIMSKLRMDFNTFTNEQFRFLSYTILGFDASSMAFLLNMTKNNVWVKKHRIKERIMSSDSTNKDLYQVFIQ